MKAGSANGLATASLIVGLIAVGLPYLVRNGADESREGLLRWCKQSVLGPGPPAVRYWSEG